MNDKARIERTLRELDGDDLRYLYALDRSLISARERYARWEAYDRRSLLLAAGCVDIDYKPLAGLGGGGGPALHVSATGRLVLRAATVYLKQRGPAFPDDLRDPEPSAVDEQRIWDGVANNPAVIAFLARVRSAAPRTTYEPPPLPRTGDVAGAVFFWGVATDVETGLDPEKAATNALLTRGIVVERRELPDQTIVNVVLLGDHDTLRVVADRLEAVWNPYAPGRR